MATKHSKSLLSLIKVGQTIAVGIAHSYTKNIGWHDYSETYYEIESISEKQVLARSTRYKNESIIITRKNLDSGRFQLRI